MKICKIEHKLEDGRVCTFRNAELKDAPALIEYLNIIFTETPYLMREKEEITFTLEQEEAYIQSQINADRELLLIAEIDGRHIGNCSIASMGNYMRYTHRCNVSIALYNKYCGLGIGREMLQLALQKAKEWKYEQAELEVVTTNERAVHLYKRLGFEIYGTQKHSMKYKDGTYADEFLMMKKL